MKMGFGLFLRSIENMSFEQNGVLKVIARRICTQLLKKDNSIN